MMRGVLIFVLLFALLPSLAQVSARDAANERQLEQRLTQIDPSSVETFKAATAAMYNEEYPRAIDGFRKVMQRNPTFDPALRRLGGCLVATGKVTEGMSLIEKAVNLRRSPENLLSLAQAILERDNGNAVPTAEIERALALAKEANEGWHGQDASALAIMAMIDLQREDLPAFREVTRSLARQFPDEGATHFFLGIDAATRNHWMTAERELKRARRLGFSAETVQGALDSGIHRMAVMWSILYTVIFLFAAWIVGLPLLFLIGKRLSNTTVRSIEQADPNRPANPNELKLRAIYRWLINIAGVYYYISVPFVILLILVLLAGVILLCLYIGHIPIKIIIIMVVVSLYTIYKMIATLFIRLKSDDPGRLLREEEAPELWSLTRDVAQTLNTRPIDEIRMMPGTEVAVYERGSARARARDRATRILLLGMGVLNGFEQHAFRAVLAHEYGHFSHRDTAGGDVSLRVNANMMTFAQALIESGMHTWWNLGFHFLRLYHLIFRRISFGSSRLQEVLADRMAAIHYGAKAFEEGLRHVIHRSLEFNAVAGEEIGKAIETRSAVQNLYALPPADPQIIEDEYEKALVAATSEDDSHPSPADRFRLVHKLVDHRKIEEQAQVWDLFTDREGLVNEMLDLLNRQTKAIGDAIAAQEAKTGKAAPPEQQAPDAAPAGTPPAENADSETKTVETR